MLTSPKVSDPFQVVRMAPRSIRGRPHSAPVSPFLHVWTSRLPSMSADRTIARLWRDAVARERTGAAYLVQHGDHWHDGHVGRGGGAGREPGQRPAGAGRAEGRGVRACSPGRRSSGRCSTSRWPRSARSRRPCTRTARRTTPPTSSTTRSPSACSARTPSRQPRSRSSERRCRGSGTCSPSPTCPALEAEGARFQRRAPDGARRGGRRDRRGRPLHAPVHVRHDRARPRAA